MKFRFLHTPAPSDCPRCFGSGHTYVGVWGYNAFCRETWYTEMCTCDVLHESMRGKRYAGVDHPVELLSWAGKIAHVDVGVVPMIKALWSEGIDTVNSCQGWKPPWVPRPGYVAVELTKGDPATEIVEQFASIDDVSVGGTGCEWRIGFTLRSEAA